ncbi:uncharacterized protein LOC143284855 isoform X2 [Babylonia areolata]|uniref:uncharacterized protein LOC143284855 isoform X2 n=1 Tax=Babylonia areolata TaxID=304850 RepID=UPI003FD1D076
MESVNVDRGRGKLQDAVALFRKLVSDSPERTQAHPWKFWRKLSTRRADGNKKPKSGATGSRYAAGSTANGGGRRTEWTHPSHLDLRPLSGTEEDEEYSGPSGSLPDVVVDKASHRRSNSLKAPPKPPRLFLFRSSSINHPRSSVDGGSARNSMVAATGGGGGGGESSGVDVLAEAEPIYVNSAFGAALKTGLSGNDRIIPPTVNNNNNTNSNNNNFDSKSIGERGGGRSEAMDVVQKHAPVHKPRRNGPLPPPPTSSTTTTTSTSNYHSLRRPSDTLSKRHPGRARRKSSERSDLSRHRHIMHSVVDLLCQRFNPFPLLKALQTAGVLTPMDVQAFQGHPDRKLICESLANVIGEGDYSLFTAFLRVVREAGGQEEIVRVLDAMGAVDRLIHDLPPTPPGAQEEEAQVLADEKMISYEVGYLAQDGTTLKPVIELERVRLTDRRLSQRMSRASGCSGDGEREVVDGGGGKVGGDMTSSVTSVSGGAGGGPVMINACITGHNLSGERAEALARVIREHDCILEMRMGKTQLRSGDVVTLCRALVDNSSLVSLDIRLNLLDFVGATAVAELLTKTRALRQLNLSSTGLDVAGCRAVLAALTSNRTLTHLDMSFLDVGDAVCESVRDALRANTCLQRLRLRSNNFSAAGCFALAEGLSRNRSLLELDLSRNCIGDDGMEALARYVPDSSLAEMSLENCGLTSSACDVLAQMLSSSKRLRTLDLSVNYLGDEGVVRLGAALERSSVLHTVGLNMCGITNDGFSALLDVLEKNASILLLKLCYNRLGREHRSPAATSDNLRYRLRIVTSSKPKLKILLWGNSFDEA